MKNLLITCVIICFGATSAMAQIYVNGKDINSMDIQYIEIEIETFSLRAESRVLVDYGQEIRTMGFKYAIVTDKRGSDETLLFYSKVEALNWFYKNGWEIKQAFNQRTGGDVSNNDIIYLMQRK